MANTSKSMAGKVCLLTGATSGIGLVTARALAEKGATVIVGARNREKGLATVDLIKQQTANPSVEFLAADLSSQREIRGLVEEYERRYERLDVLLNNAGAFFLRRQVSVDGIEMTLAVNCLAPFLLNNLLLDRLKASAPARILNVSSAVHKSARLDWADLQGERSYRRMGLEAYGRAKLALVMLTYEWARRLQGTGVTVNAIHPGFVATNIGANNGWIVRLARPFINMRAISPEEGAETNIYLASSPEVEGVTGKYFARKELVPSSPASYDEAAGRRLWGVCAELTGLDV